MAAVEIDVNDPRLEITLGRRILHREGCESHVGGQLTARAGDGSGFWATGFNYFDQGEPGDVARLGWRLEVLEGEFALAAAMSTHCLIYQRRPDVNAVVHLHSPYVTAFSSTGRTIGMYDVTAVCFAGEQAIYSDDGAKPHSSVVDCLGDARVVLMRGHGALVASDSVPHGVVEALTVERCAHIHLLASLVGGEEIPPAEVAAGRQNFRPHYLHNMWEANRARVLREDPDLGAVRGRAD